MSQNNCIGSSWRRTGLALSLGAIVLAGLASCKPYKPEADLRWEETVTLSSGESVRIRRHAVFRQELAWGGGFASAPVFTVSSIEMISPVDDFVTWDAPLVPILLDRDPVTHEWVVVGGSDHDAFWQFNGQPCPPVWFFRLSGGIWRLEVLPQEHIGRTPNLLADFRPTSEWKFDPEVFAREAAIRKERQLGPDPKLSLEMRQIGALYPHLRRCKSEQSPTLAEPDEQLKQFRRP